MEDVLLFVFLLSYIDSATIVSTGIHIISSCKFMFENKYLHYNKCEYYNTTTSIPSYIVLARQNVVPTRMNPKCDFAWQTSCIAMAIATSFITSRGFSFCYVPSKVN